MIMSDEQEVKALSSMTSETMTNRQDTSASSLPENRLFLRRKVLDTPTLDDYEYLPNPSKPPPGKRAVLTAVRTRSKIHELAITPDIAARAVKEYLLPMFEADGRKVSSKVRNDVFNKRGTGLDQLPALEAVTGTVYGELKLSDELSMQLTELKRKLRDMEQEFRDALQDRESAQSGYSTLEKKYLKVASDLKLLNQQYSLSEQHYQQMELRFISVNSQLSEYKQLYHQVETEKKQLSSQLHEEKALNDKLKNKAIELEHGNSLLMMENDIVGERLKGLYEAISQISHQKLLEDKLGAEVQILARACYALTEFDADVTHRMAAALNERDHLREDFGEMAKLRQEAKEDREIIAIASKDKITVLQDCLDKSREEVEMLKLEVVKLDKLCKGMEDEMEKMRTKMKQNRLKRRQYGESEEKICRKCQRVFIDSENFNWSCRTHKSEYGDEMWWCCGKTGKDAPGCMVSKHESKEDEEEDGSKAKEESERIKVANMRCPVISQTEL